MVLRLALAGVFVVATAGTALAQAPGEMEPSAPPAYAPPSAPPAYGPPCAWSSQEPVMANRWSIGLSVGSLGIAPDSNPNAKSQFGVGELSLRFRATPHLELALAVSGGREQIADGTQGDNEVHMGLLAARYRFAIESRWNWWLMGGMGAMSVAPYYATQDQRKANERPMGRFGIGIERRFHRFALQAELAGIGVAPPRQDANPQLMVGGKPGGSPAPSGMRSMQMDSGGMMTIGASYYF